jgi:hypothetical protein
MPSDLFGEWFGSVEGFPTSKKKKAYINEVDWTQNNEIFSGKSFGGYLKSAPDMGSDFGVFLSKSDIFGTGKKTGHDMGIGNTGLMSVGGDYMDYVAKAGNLKSDDFMSYLESGSPKAFRTIGKEPKNITKRRFADKDMQVEYGAESIGFATEGLERNIHKSAKNTFARAQKTRKEINAGVQKIKTNVKEGRLGFDEESVGGKLISKIKERKGRKEARKEIEDFMANEDRQVLVQKREEDGKSKLYRYVKEGKIMRKEEIRDE